MLNNIYKDFCDNTGLKDSAYEAVFTKINDTLSFINDIDWVYLTYSDTESEYASTFNFKKKENIPLYIAELIKNAFGGYYTLPKSTVVSICLMYKGQEHIIISNSEYTEIPNEVRFLKDYNIFNLFFLSHPVRDIFNEFDNIFKFVDKFKSPVNNILPALEKRFAKVTQEISDEKTPSAKERMNDKLLSEILEDKIKESLFRIDQIKTERENLENKTAEIIDGVSDRDFLLKEKEKLILETSTLLESKEEFERRLERLTDIVREIDSNLSYAIDHEGDAENIEYLKDKKTIFEHDRLSVDKSLRDLTTLIKIASTNLDTIKRTLGSIEGYTQEDLDKMGKRIDLLNRKQDNTYTEMLKTESELKKIRAKSLNEQLKIEKAQMTYADSSIQSIENSSIASHLSSPLQPISVITVLNYLRYYFGYHTTMIANELLDKNPNENVYILQAIASRLTLIRQFGIKFNVLFSVFTVLDENIKKLITIIKD